MKYASVALVGVFAVAACTTHGRQESETYVADTGYRADVNDGRTPTGDVTVYEEPRFSADVPATSDANNTSVNVRDRDESLPTPFDQKSNAADIARTTAIRKRVMDAKLSIDAQNVKIITQNGRVTLRGPVKNQMEKDTVDRIARDVAGYASVDDLIEVIAAR